jgi:hypothetical protein
LHTPILIDTVSASYLNKSNIEIIFDSSKVNSHSYFSTLSFTKYDYNLTLFQSDLSENSVYNILKKIYDLKLKNPIFMPFGSDVISNKISEIFNLFDKNQLFCSFNNISDKKNFPSVHENVTPISSLDYNGKFYFKKCNTDILWYYRIDPIKIKQRSLSFNSFILGDLYFALSNSLKINKKKEITMPTWNFKDNYEFVVKKNELFGFKITDSSSKIVDNIEGIFFDNGFLYGSTEIPVELLIESENETRNFKINPAKDNNYQFSILAKKL